MLVCICKGISDRDIKEEIFKGASGFGEIRSTLGVGSCCGMCAPFAKNLVNETLGQAQIPENSTLAYEVRAC